MNSYMDVSEILKGHLHVHDIRGICAECSQDPVLAESLLALAAYPEDKIAYNALWTLTHLPPGEIKRHPEWRDRLIDTLLATQHTSKQRLLLTLLEKMPSPPEETRTDYLDFCLTHINSTAPYAIRALSLKQAYAQCRPYPELLRELETEIEMMEYGELSPGLLSARRNILKKLRPAK